MHVSPRFFFFNDTATTEIYTLSLHDALPISRCARWCARRAAAGRACHGTRAGRSVAPGGTRPPPSRRSRSEEHTFELQSPCNLVCRLLLEKKNDNTPTHATHVLIELHLVRMP